MCIHDIINIHRYHHVIYVIIKAIKRFVVVGLGKEEGI